MPRGPFEPNGKKIALIGAGPSSLKVARDLAPLGYEIHGQRRPDDADDANCRGICALRRHHHRPVAKPDYG